MTRKDFLKTTAGAATLAAIPASGALASACKQPESTGIPKRGVSVYSWTDYGELNVSMTLEDCFKDIYDTGAHGLEILSSYIHGYPNPTDEWYEWWWEMMEKYELIPVEFGHFVDSRLYAPPREVTTQESYDMLVRDLKIANKCGFTRTRTRIGHEPDGSGLLVRNWKEWMEMALPVAEELNIKMCCEIHNPSRVSGPNGSMVEDCLEFIERTGTEWFGFNIDFGIFQTGQASNYLPYSREGQERLRRQQEQAAAQQQTTAQQQPSAQQRTPQNPQDIIPILPYTYACHAKFYNVNEDCEDTTIPYPEVIDVMIKQKWDGYLLSEYEGPNKDVPGYSSTQVKRQHVLLKKLLGE